VISHPQNKTVPHAPPAGAAVTVEDMQHLYALLRQAAEAAAHAGMPPDAFAAAAWQAYLAASPELAERLADLQFEAAVEELRSSGRMAKA
jgi:hypothetical protein